MNTKTTTRAMETINPDTYDCERIELLATLADENHEASTATQTASNGATPRKATNSTRTTRNAVRIAFTPTTLAKVLEQHDAMKQKYPDTIPLFRAGDFYEAYKEDAQTVADILGITVTLGNITPTEQIKFAGFPHHALEEYLPKLVRAGKRVAICEQLQAPQPQPRRMVSRRKSELPTNRAIEAFEEKYPNNAVLEFIPVGENAFYAVSQFPERRTPGLTITETMLGKYYSHEWTLNESGEFNPGELSPMFKLWSKARKWADARIAATANTIGK